MSNTGLNMLEMIANLRGGIPDNCDFCGKPFTEENYPTPEECGEWACIGCVTRWDNELKENK
jgi:hypothetical protein